MNSCSKESPIYFFGCWDRTGHYLYGPGGKSIWNLDIATPWGLKLDGGLCPGRHGSKPWQFPELQVEGHASLTREKGWTALSFWDRSVDSRMNSNSNFVAQGDFSFEELIDLAKQHFPEIMSRFKFKITLIGNPL